MAKKIASMTDKEKAARLKTMAAKEGAKPKMAAGDRLAARLTGGGKAMGARTAAGAKMTGGSSKFEKGERAKIVVSRSGGNT
jgi:hypothetical protein